LYIEEKLHHVLLRQAAQLPTLDAIMYRAAFNEADVP